MSASRAAPLFSVVICTRNRAALLGDALVCLQRQELPRDLFEVLVVDNGSTDATRTVVERFAPLGNVHWRLEERVGLSHARNRGWREAKGEYVAYTDDDCRVPPQWLSVAHEIATAHSPGVFGGPYYALFESARPSWYKDSYGSYEHAATEGPMTENEFLSGDNFFVSRRLLEASGGFDPRLGMTGGTIAYGEESELQRRLRETRPGLLVYYSPRLFIRHLVRPEKMRWPWIVRCQFSAGSYYFRWALSGRVETFSRRKIFVQALATCGALVVDVARGLLRRDVARYPHRANYLYESSCLYVERLGQLWERFRETRTVRTPRTAA